MKYCVVYQDRGNAVDPFPNIGGVFGPFDDEPAAQHFVRWQRRQVGFTDGAFNVCLLTSPELAMELGSNDVKPPPDVEPQGRIVPLAGRGRLSSYARNQAEFGKGVRPEDS